MTKIKKVVITAFGDESTLAIVEDTIADPGDGEVQITVEYTIVSAHREYAGSKGMGSIVIKVNPQELQFCADARA
jgi:hypothetical protein